MKKHIVKYHTNIYHPVRTYDNDDITILFGPHCARVAVKFALLTEAVLLQLHPNHNPSFSPLEKTLLCKPVLQTLTSPSQTCFALHSCQNHTTKVGGCEVNIKVHCQGRTNAQDVMTSLSKDRGCQASEWHIAWSLSCHRAHRRQTLISIEPRPPIEKSCWQAVWLWQKQPCQKYVGTRFQQKKSHFCWREIQTERHFGWVRAEGVVNRLDNTLRCSDQPLVFLKRGSWSWSWSCAALTSCWCS